MAELDRAALEELVRRVLLEKLGEGGPRVKKVEVPRLDVAAEHRMDTGIQEEYLQLAAGRGVAALVGGQQAAQSGYSFCHIELLLVRIGRP